MTTPTKSDALGGKKLKRFRVTYIDHVYAETANDAVEIVARSIDPELITNHSRVRRVPNDD